MQVLPQSPVPWFTKGRQWDSCEHSWVHIDTASSTFCLPALHKQCLTSIRDTTGREVFLTQAVGTSVPGDCVPHRPCAKGRPGCGKHSRLQLLTFSPQLTPHIPHLSPSTPPPHPLPGFITVTLSAPVSCTQPVTA